MGTDSFIAPERWVTPDFVVRGYQLGDGVLLAEAVNASFEHLTTFMPWAKPYQSVEDSALIVRRFHGRYLLNADFVLGIFSADEGKLLGGSGFHLREGGLAERSAEIGMWIRAEAAGKGLGTAVLKALLAWGFTEWPWERLAWHCDGRNLASRRTAEKAGMAHEGVLRQHSLMPDGSRRDTVLFAMLKEEWERNH